MKVLRNDANLTLWRVLLTLLANHEVSSIPRRLGF
jgi:hypothetical protein